MKLKVNYLSFILNQNHSSLRTPLFLYSVLLLSLLLLSCSDPKLENPFDMDVEILPPSNLNISQTSITSCQLTWTDNSTNEQGFRIDRKKDSEAWIVGYINVGANVTELNEQDLEAPSTYSYKVYGFADENVTTTIEGNINMSFPAPTNLTYEKQTITSICLSWQDNCIFEEGYIIEKKAGEDPWQIEYATVSENLQEWTDTSVEINEEIQYRVYAYSGTTQSGSIETGIIDNTFPAPTNLNYEQISINSIQLSWQDNSIGEEGFQIDKKVGTNTWLEEYGIVGENTETWIDTAVEIIQEIQYRIFSYHSNSQSGTIETGIIINITIPAPENLTYNVQNQSGLTADVHLSWDYFTSGIEGFKVKRNGTLLSVVISAGTTEWTDEGVNIQSTYVYQVVAFYQSYYSAFSNEVTVVYGPIYDIQYTTVAGPDGGYPSPLVGDEVTVTGIVTGANFGHDLYFYMSDPCGGAWHGIYVYDYVAGPSLGDHVEVTGTVSEYYGSTQLEYCTVTILSSGNPVPEPISVSTLNLVGPAQAEQYEGCLVELTNVTVTESQVSFGEWYVDDGSGECQIDDGFFYLDEVVPPIVIFLNDVWVNLTGIVDFSYDEYGVNPRTPDDMVHDPSLGIHE